MKTRITSLIIALSSVCCICSFSTVSSYPAGRAEKNTIESRFTPPLGYVRIEEEKTSFGIYLRSLPLKPAGSLVTYYNGSKKNNKGVYDAVIDLPIGKKDLHQCADAVMRLRADYFYNQKSFDRIHFNFTNGFNAAYSRWRNGERIVVKGNIVKWAKTAKPSDTYENYWNYMETVFNYAGTASLAKELKVTQTAAIKIGDVFIKGGFPGHAVIVVDIAIQKSTNKKVFLLAQSYMPAQEIQVLKNPKDKSLSPWYSADFGEILVTPEWTFKSSELKQF